MRRSSRDTDNLKQQNLEEFGMKIKKYRKTAGMTAEDLAKELGVAIGSVRNWECGMSRPDPTYLIRMFHVLDVDPNTFFEFRGAGEALADGEKKLVGLYRNMDKRHQTDYIALGEALLRQSDEWKMKEAQEICDNIVVLGDWGRYAAAGPMSDWPGETEKEEVFLYRNHLTEEADEVFTVSGDSMEPSFHNGDRVLVQYCREAHEGNIYIFKENSIGYMIKVAGKEGMLSLNPEYDDLIPWDENGAELIGRVLGVIDPIMTAKKEEINLYREYGQH